MVVMSGVKNLEDVIRSSSAETVIGVSTSEDRSFSDPYTIKTYVSGLEPIYEDDVPTVIVEGILGVVVHLANEVGYRLAEFHKKQLKAGKTLEIKSKGNIYKISKGVN